MRPQPQPEDGAPAAAVEQAVLARITPSRAEEEALAADADALVAAAQAELARLGLSGRATIQGSVAKGTWLAGGGDLDLFLLLDPSLSLERLERVALEAGPRVLQDTQRRYAQHPYLVGRFRDRTVDLVPAYAVAAATAKMSAVDRTPFHTAWALANLDDRLRGEVRLAKRWLKGVGAYGAQTAVGGFSGYLVEVLVVRLGSLRGLLGWLAGDARPRRHALGPDEVQDDVSPLVVVDPVDPARNCAAAVQEETLALACQAARTYLAAPSELFFFPAPPRPEPADALRRHQAAAGESWQALLLRPRTGRLDIVFPQFQKAARTIAAHLEEAGFPVVRLRTHADEAKPEVLLEWVTRADPLPATRLHRGPPDDARPNAERFREKYACHPDAAGPVRRGADGRLEVELRNLHRTASARLAADLAALPLGRHAADALPDAAHWTDVTQATPAWAPAVADTVLDRQPWER